MGRALSGNCARTCSEIGQWHRRNTITESEITPIEWLERSVYYIFLTKRFTQGYNFHRNSTQGVSSTRYFMTAGLT